MDADAFGQMRVSKALFQDTLHALDRLQLREEEPGSLQVRRLKSFGEPGIQVA